MCRILKGKEKESWDCDNFCLALSGNPTRKKATFYSCLGNFVARTPWSPHRYYYFRLRLQAKAIEDMGKATRRAGVSSLWELRQGPGILHLSRARY